MLFLIKHAWFKESIIKLLDTVFNIYYKMRQIYLDIRLVSQWLLDYIYMLRIITKMTSNNAFWIRSLVLVFCSTPVHLHGDLVNGL